MRTIYFLISVVLFAPNSTLAQDIDRFKPKPIQNLTDSKKIDPTPPPAVEEGDGAESLGTIYGIALVSSPSQVAVDNPPAIRGVKSIDDQLLVPDRVIEVLQKYLNGPLSLNSLNGINRDAVLAYREAGLPVVDIGLPEQNVSTGIIQLVVVIGKVGEVSVEGNHYFNEKIYSRSFTSSTGDLIWHENVLSDLRFLNRNPYRDVGVLYTPGEDFGQTDVILSTSEIRPYSAYIGYENTGNSVIGVDRILYGFEWGNVGGWDHIAAYQYTTSPEFEGVHGHSWIYRAPIPQFRHELQLLASYVETGVEIPSLGGGAFTSGGQSTQISPTYVVPLDTLAGYEQEIQIGFDFKSTNNNLEFGGLRITDSTAEIWQFGAGHQMVKDTGRGTRQLFHKFVWSPGELSSHNTDDRFQDLRALASSDYLYWRGEINELIELPNDFRFLASVKGQISNGNLLPSESLILGGVGSVRGFEQNITRADRGLQMNLELYGPSFSPLSWIQGETDLVETGDKGGKQLVEAAGERLDDHARLFGFFDYALAGNNDLLPGETDGINLGGTGLGLDYRIARHFNLRLAHGWQASQSGFIDDLGSRWHVSATARW